MFRLAAITCILAVALASPFAAELDGEWELYKQTYDKIYTKAAEGLRLVACLYWGLTPL